MKKALLTLAAVALAAGAAQAQTYQKYMPGQEGNKWTHLNMKFGGMSTVAVDDSWYGMFYLTGFPGLGDGAWAAWSANTLYVWNADAGAWKTFLRFGAYTGTKYTISLGSGTFYENVQVTVASKSTTFNDEPIQQTFYNCVRFTFGPMPGLADAGVGELVFAPNVGLVRSEEQSIAGPVTKVLYSGYANGKKIGWINITELEAGPHTQYPVSGTNQVLLINSETAWQNFYAQHKPGEPVPAINFAKNSVVVALAGTRPTGGYYLKAQLVRWNFPYSGAKLFMQENKPGPGVIVTMALTSPYQILVLEEKVYSVSKSWTVVEYSMP